jgi:hypothetical protein
MSRLSNYSLVFLMGLFGSWAVATPQNPPGELLASIEMIEGSFAPIKGRTGWWFQREPSLAGGYSVTGYEYRNGKLVDEFGGGSEDRLIDALDDIGLKQFDFDAAIESANQVMVSRAKEEADLVFPGVRDGARFRVTIATSAGKVVIEAWNPGSTADGLAPFNEDLSRLKRAFDLLRGFYADSKLQF